MTNEELQAENERLRKLLAKADYVLCEFARIGMNPEEKEEWTPVPGSIIEAVHNEVHNLSGEV